MTRARVDVLTTLALFNTRETVAVETLARRATCSRFIWRCPHCTCFCGADTLENTTWWGGPRVRGRRPRRLAGWAPEFDSMGESVRSGRADQGVRPTMLVQPI